MTRICPSLLSPCCSPFAPLPHYFHRLHQIFRSNLQPPCILFPSPIITLPSSTIINYQSPPPTTHHPPPPLTYHCHPPPGAAHRPGRRALRRRVGRVAHRQKHVHQRRHLHCHHYGNLLAGDGFRAGGKALPTGTRVPGGGAEGDEVHPGVSGRGHGETGVSRVLQAGEWG